MNTIHRLAKFHKHLKESGYGGRNVFEEAIGKKPGYLTVALKRESSIGSDVLETLSKIFPDLNLEWLLTGEGSMLKSELQHTASLSPPQKEEDPLFGGPEIEAKDDIIKRQESQIEFLKEVISIKEREIVDKDFAISELTKKIKILEGDLANRNLVQKKEKTA